jgi:hypothetical protein
MEQRSDIFSLEIFPIKILRQQRATSSMSDMEHSHQGTIDHEDDPVITVEKLTDLYIEGIILRRQRTTLWKTAER